MNKMTQPPPCLRALLLAISAVSLLTVSGNAQKWELRSETVYSRGDYGSGVTTEVLYAPLELRRIFDWGEVGLTVPYLWYHSSGDFLYIDNTFGPQIQSIPVSEHGEGISDLLLDAQFRVVSQQGNRPEVLIRGYWKPPTASTRRGLGTGSHDWILGTEFWSWLPESQQYFYFGNVYYDWVGEQTDQPTDNSWIFELGLGGVVTDSLVAKLSYKEQTAITPGLPSFRSAILETEYKLGHDLKILSGFTVGLSDGAPDWSAMLGFEKAF